MERITDAIIDGLRLCETSYQNHVKEMGKVTERDVQAWGIALNGLTPDQIRNAFLEHIQAKNYWPKPADIRGGVLGLRSTTNRRPGSRPYGRRSFPTRRSPS